MRLWVLGGPFWMPFWGIPSRCLPIVPFGGSVWELISASLGTKGSLKHFCNSNIERHKTVKKSRLCLALSFISLHFLFVHVCCCLKQVPIGGTIYSFGDQHPIDTVHLLCGRPGRGGWDERRVQQTGGVTSCISPPLHPV